jgi:hypothetical protein
MDTSEFNDRPPSVPDPARHLCKCLGYEPAKVNDDLQSLDHIGIKLKALMVACQAFEEQRAIVVTAVQKPRRSSFHVPEHLHKASSRSSALTAKSYRRPLCWADAPFLRRRRWG